MDNKQIWHLQTVLTKLFIIFWGGSTIVNKDWNCISKMGSKSVANCSTVTPISSNLLLQTFYFQPVLLLVVVGEGNTIPRGVIMLVMLCHHLIQFIFIMQLIFICIQINIYKWHQFISTIMWLPLFAYIVQ